MPVHGVAGGVVMRTQFFTNSVCPHCGAILNGTAVQIVCQECRRGDVPLYTLHIGGQTLTLCMDCIQHRLMFRQAGPSETKAGEEVTRGA